MAVADQKELMMLQDVVEKHAHGGPRYVGALWTNGVVKYCVAPGASDKMKKEVAASIEHYTQQVPCLKFQEVSAVDVYKCSELPSIVFVEAGGGCTSMVGMGTTRATRSRRINLSPNGCLVKGIIVHEIGHAIGMVHEQSRPDRDKYVKILWQNIDLSQQDKQANFKGFAEAYAGSPYDFLSLMHYGSA